jgi:hypothetical protein
MTKRILTLTFIACFLGFPIAGHAMPAVEIMEQMQQAVNIAVNGSSIHITGANGQNLIIYNITGVIVQSFKVEGTDKHYDLNLPKGCYIIKVGKTVRKISIR